VIVNQRRAAALLIATALLGVSSCSFHESEDETQRAQAARIARPFPAGRWRLLSFEELDQTVLWISHILIRHNRSEYDQLNAIRPQEWGVAARTPGRTREQALSLALSLAKQLQAAPQQFASFAHKYSDEIGSKDVGGSLGGVRASQLGPLFRDAFQATSVGQVSDVFET
jgi:hypothetical protein